METAAQVIGVVMLAIASGFIGWHAQIKVAEHRRRTRLDRLIRDFKSADKSAQDA